MFPDELKQYPQWVVWRNAATGKGAFTKIPHCPTTGKLASTDDPTTWSSYECAAMTAKMHDMGIGFVLTSSDPYGVIDLDPESSNQEIITRQIKIEQEFDSYSEISPNSGLHVWVRTIELPAGRRRDKVEIYTSGRFMTVTGNTFRDRPIVDRTVLLRTLWEEIGGNNGHTNIQAIESEQKHEDSVIYQFARSAANGDKFDMLWRGEWNVAGYSSQSEADFALINILSFYSRNLGQIKRMFLSSEYVRGKDTYHTKKLERRDYLDKMIQRSFDNQVPPVDFTELDKNIREEIQHVATPNPFAGPLFASIDDPNYDYTTPPGLLGEIATFIYDSSPRQVKEIALASAIGLMAGICGRAYNVSNTGLNQYVLLLAKTGTGKDSVNSGIDKLMREVRLQCPASQGFIGPSAIASGQALVKYLVKQPCFVSIVGEFGLMLQAMCSFHANPTQIILRKVLLELYMKSGHNEVLRETIYSDKANNSPIVASPSFSLLGESTPAAYYGGLDEAMIAQGLLPRFLCIEYGGRVPYLNEKHFQIKPMEQLVSKVSDVCVNCLTLMANGAVINVTMSGEAQSFSREYSRKTTDAINVSDAVIAEELWNRAHLKTIKLAALIAIGLNPYNPEISLECVQWAQNLVERDIKNVFARFDRGEIGKDTNETNQIKEMEEVIADYVRRPYDDVMKKYLVDERMMKDKVISWQYLQRRLNQRATYRNDRMGANTAMKRSMESIIASGTIREIRQMDMWQRYQLTAKGFLIADIAYFMNVVLPYRGPGRPQKPKPEPEPSL
jgi:primase/DNA polymerase family protein